MKIWLPTTVLIICISFVSSKIAYNCNTFMDYIYSSQVFSDEEPFEPLNVTEVIDLIRLLEMMKLNLLYEIKDLDTYMDRLKTNNLATFNESLSKYFQVRSIELFYESITIENSLQKEAPKCYKQSIDTLIEDIMKIFNDENATPCFKILNLAKQGFIQLLNDVCCILLLFIDS